MTHDVPGARGPVLAPALLTTHCRALLADVPAPTPSLLRLAAGLEQLCGSWSALWRDHAGDRQGWPAYRALLERAAGQLAAVPALALADGSTLRDRLAALLRLAAPQPARERQAPSAAADVPVLDRPLFLVGAPLAGTSLLFEALSLVEDVWATGGDTGRLVEAVPSLSLAARGFRSDQLDATHATGGAVHALLRAYAPRLRDCDGGRWSGAHAPLRLLDEGARHALRVPFLAQAFPEARFVLVLREPLANVAAMLEAWRAGTRVSHERLPDWGGGRWSLPLVAGWKALEGRPLAEVAAAQYQAIMATLASDLSTLPRQRWMAVALADLLEKPAGSLAAICRFADIAPHGSAQWRPPPAALANALSADNAAALESHAPALASAALALQGLADGEPPPAQDPVAAVPVALAAPAAAPAAPGPAVAVAAAPATPADPRLRALASVHTSSFADILERAGASLLVSTYQAGKLVLVRREGDAVNTGFKELRKPMGIAHEGGRLAVGTAGEVRLFANVPAAAGRLQGAVRSDAVFMPRATHFTGNIDIHEMAFAEDGLWLVNTRFGCLCTLDQASSFVPRWMPPFLSGLAPEDRCHLNGLGLRDGRVRYVTMLGATDAPGGWRANKASGGLLMDLDGDRIVCEGLSMPHSPRWYRGHLWVLESGNGALCRIDAATSRRETVAELPGFTRGLDFLGPLAFIGLSQVRESAVFARLPLTERLSERTCGVWVVNIERGETVGFLRFEESVQEIFAVNVLPGARHPELVLPGDPLCADTFALPDAALARVPDRLLAGTAAGSPP